MARSDVERERLKSHHEDYRGCKGETYEIIRNVARKDGTDLDLPKQSEITKGSTVDASHPPAITGAQDPAGAAEEAPEAVKVPARASGIVLQEERRIGHNYCQSQPRSITRVSVVVV